MNVADIIKRQTSGRRGNGAKPSQPAKTATKVASTATVVAKQLGSNRQGPVKTVVRAPSGHVASAADIVARQISMGRGASSRHSASVKYNAPNDVIRERLMAEFKDYLAKLEAESAKNEASTTTDESSIALTQDIIDEATNAFVEETPSEEAPLANGIDLGSEVGETVVMKQSRSKKKKKTETAEVSDSAEST